MDGKTDGGKDPTGPTGEAWQVEVVPATVADAPARLKQALEIILRAAARPQQAPDKSQAAE